MWPVYVLFNKFLKEEVGELNGRHTDFVTMYKNQNAVLPRSHFVKVPHIGQLHSWDCGLACVLMVMRTLGIYDCDFHVLEELCNTTSIWTVDLAYILQKFYTSFAFFTVTLGANPDYSVETFYKDHLPQDVVRVDRLFQKSLDAGINIQRRSLSSEELSVLILSGNYIAIALVDQYKLSRSWPGDVCVSGLYDVNAGYTGHFVVVCGYDADKGEFEIRDPASTREYERVTMDCLEDSRKSYGTDEDLLLISMKKRDGETEL